MLCQLNCHPAAGSQGGALRRGISHLEPSFQAEVSAGANPVPILQCSLADRHRLTGSLLVCRVPRREAGVPAVSGRPYRARGLPPWGRMLMAGESLCSSRRAPGPSCHMPHINREAGLQCLVSAKPPEQPVSQDQLCPGTWVRL